MADRTLRITGVDVADFSSRMKIWSIECQKFNHVTSDAYRCEHCGAMYRNKYDTCKNCSKKMRGDTLPKFISIAEPKKESVVAEQEDDLFDFLSN